MEQHIKTNAQLMARCFFNKITGKVVFEDFTGYYPTMKSKRDSLTKKNYGETEKIYHILYSS